MVSNFLDIIIVNFFWLIFLIPGFGAYLLLKKLSNKPTDDYFALKFVYSFFLSCMLLSPIAILAYLFTVGRIFSVIYFSSLLALGLYSIIKIKEPSFCFPKITRFPTTKVHCFKPDFWTILIIIIVFADFVVSTTIKGYINFGFDSWAHMAKINMDVFQGFSAYDPYLLNGASNVIQSNYASNIIHVIMAFPGQLFEVDTIWTWAYSTSFFRILSIALVYVFIRTLTKNRSLSLFAAILYYIDQAFSMGFMLTAYPLFMGFLTSVFTVKILLDIKNQETFSKKINFVLYALCIVLVSLAHQVIFSLLAIFLGVAFLLLVLIKKLDFKRFTFLSLPILLGLPTAVFTLINSRFVPDTVLDINNDLYYWTDKIYSLRNPATYLDAGMIVVFLGLFLTLKYAEKEEGKLLIFYTFAFNGLLLYTPFFMLIHLALPTWAIVRFDYFFALITLTFKTFVLWYFIKHIGTINFSSKRINTILILSLLFILAMFKQSDVRTFYDYSSSNQATYVKALDLANLSRQITNKSVVLADSNISFSLPALATVYVAGMDDTRTTDSIDTSERDAEVLKFFHDDTNTKDRLATIEKYDISYVVLTDEEVEAILPEELGLTEIEHSKYYYLYKAK